MICGVRLSLSTALPLLFGLTNLTLTVLRKPLYWVGGIDFRILIRVASSGCFVGGLMASG